MIQVEVRDQKEVYLVSLDHVNKGKSIHASETRMDSAVKHDLLVLELHNVTASAHLQS